MYILTEKTVKEDLTALKDTERAIVTMYRELKALGSDYELVLGRKMMEKLKDYITGNYVVLEYGTILNELVEHVKTVFDCTDIVPQEGGFLQVDDEELPFD